jgi:putative glutamine amidotransferase
MSRPPLIAITATTRLDGGARRVRLNTSYLTAVERAGGIPLVIPPLASVADATRVLDAADALLLSGGEDIEPARYGATPHPKLEEVNLARDATEIALTAAARERAMPTLAICRGLQLVNVALGGSLIQDIPSERPNAINHTPNVPRDQRAHEIKIEPSSRLGAMFGNQSYRVNSIHHQAADRVAEGLRATAWAPDGIIEGLEWHNGDWWLVAVQWHPEELNGEDEKLFEAFVASV